jgi:hypothetical protein
VAAPGLLCGLHWTKWGAALAGLAPLWGGATLAGLAATGSTAYADQSYATLAAQSYALDLDVSGAGLNCTGCPRGPVEEERWRTRTGPCPTLGPSALSRTRTAACASPPTVPPVTS